MPCWQGSPYQRLPGDNSSVGCVEDQHLLSGCHGAHQEDHLLEAAQESALSEGDILSGRNASLFRKSGITGSPSVTTPCSLTILG